MQLEQGGLAAMLKPALQEPQTSFALHEAQFAMLHLKVQTPFK